MNSCIYEGRVRHRRFLPREHRFDYRLYLMYLDLDELPSLFKPYWLWSVDRFNLAYFDRRQHHGDANEPLKESISKLVVQHTGKRPQGPIRLLTHLRYFGYGFNPVSFYYCFDRQDSRVETIVAEVNNTPWGEQHCYVLDADNSSGSERIRRFRFDKRFHVSPFMEMALRYDWVFSKPEENLSVHMRNLKGGQRVFDATMRLQAAPINSRSLARVLVGYPLMTFKVIAAIYYQALRLWLKKIPVYTHPHKKEALTSAKHR